MKRDKLDEYFDQTLDECTSYNTILENVNVDSLDEANFNDLITLKNRFNGSKLQFTPNNKSSFLIGSMIKYKKAERNDEEVAQIMEEKNLTKTFTTESGKIVYTSPDLKLNNIEVRFISSASKACSDGYSCMDNVGSLKNLMIFYDILKENKEARFKHFLVEGCKWLYEDRNETIDKNYKWISENWLKIKNLYIYTIYQKDGTYIYCDAEIDISRFKGLQDYMSKKSCAYIWYGTNINTGNWYVGQDILTDRTELWKLTPVK